MFAVNYLLIAINNKGDYHIFWELNEIRLRGFFLESTVPDLGNSSGGKFFL